MTNAVNVDEQRQNVQSWFNLLPVRNHWIEVAVGANNVQWAKRLNIACAEWRKLPDVQLWMTLHEVSVQTKTGAKGGTWVNSEEALNRFNEWCSQGCVYSRRSRRVNGFTV